MWFWVGGGDYDEYLVGVCDDDVFDLVGVVCVVVEEGGVFDDVDDVCECVFVV